MNETITLYRNLKLNKNRMLCAGKLGQWVEAISINPGGVFDPWDQHGTREPSPKGCSLISKIGAMI